MNRQIFNINEYGADIDVKFDDVVSIGAPSFC